MPFEVRWRGAAAVAIVAVCTAATVVPAGREPIDESYRTWVHDGRGDVDPYQLYFFVKAVAQQERLRVCATFVAEMSDQRFERLISALRNPSSYLRIGGADNGPYFMRPSFVTGTRTLSVEPSPLSERLPRARMRAVCVDTDAPWRAEYAGEFALGLYDLKSRAQILGAGRRF